jgi:hypothetical protein
VPPRCHRDRGGQTKEYEAARAGIQVRPGEFAEKVEVRLSPLPCFKGLSERERRARYRAMVAGIEREARKKFGRGGRRVLGVRGILKQHPHRRFVQLYRVASKRLRSGDLSVRFPANCFPPRLAFSGPDPPG